MRYEKLKPGEVIVHNGEKHRVYALRCDSSREGRCDGRGGRTYLGTVAFPLWRLVDPNHPLDGHLCEPCAEVWKAEARRISEAHERASRGRVLPSPGEVERELWFVHVLRQREEGRCQPTA